MSRFVDDWRERRSKCAAQPTTTQKTNAPPGGRGRTACAGSRRRGRPTRSWPRRARLLKERGRREFLVCKRAQKECARRRRRGSVVGAASFHRQSRQKTASRRRQTTTNQLTMRLRAADGEGDRGKRAAAGAAAGDRRRHHRPRRSRGGREQHGFADALDLRKSIDWLRGLRRLLSRARARRSRGGRDGKNRRATMLRRLRPQQRRGDAARRCRTCVAAWCIPARRHGRSQGPHVLRAQHHVSALLGDAGLFLCVCTQAEALWQVLLLESNLSQCSAMRFVVVCVCVSGRRRIHTRSTVTQHSKRAVFVSMIMCSLHVAVDLNAVSSSRAQSSLGRRWRRAVPFGAAVGVSRRRRRTFSSQKNINTLLQPLRILAGRASRHVFFVVGVHVCVCVNLLLASAEGGRTKEGTKKGELWW